MTRLILIRHGQTVWHSDGVERAEGRAEVDLDEVGVQQARATAARLKDWDISAVCSSPLKRAMSTATILAARRGLTVQPEAGLIDIDYGRWQGMTHPQARADDPKLYELWLRRPHQVTFPGGEGLAEVRKRAVNAIQTLVPRHDRQTVVLVSHKVVIKVLLCHFLGLDDTYFWRFQQSFCAINVVEADGGSATVHLLNDACHIERAA
ncbi:MAG: histidine phosphatase family protein [Dehalococcoidia bacterium]|nr:histidine phosphatase family protein [Dehalococcoidia bacterium]